MGFICLADSRCYNDLPSDSWYCSTASLARKTAPMQVNRFSIPSKLISIVACLVLLGVVLFSREAKAVDTIYQETYNQSPLVPHCFILSDGTQGQGTTTCDSNPGNGVTASSVYQELRIEPTSADPDIAVKRIDLSIYRSFNEGGNPITIRAILINDGMSVATSTDTTFDPGNDTDFDVSMTFTSAYHVTASTPVDGVQFQISGSGATTDKINIRLAPNLYPPNFVNPGFYSGFYCLGGFYPIGCDGQLQSLRDFAIRIWRSDTTFSITYPYNNSTINDYPNVTITGTCESSAVEVQIYDGVTYASSTNAFGSTRSCSSSAWFYSFQPTQGFWNVFATSTEGSDGIVFFYLAQSYEPLPVSPTSSNPFATSTSLFFGLDCSSETTLSIFCTLAGRIGTGRPFSYFPQIVGSFWTAMDNATGTDWIEPVPFTTTAGLIYIPGIESSIFDGMPTNFKTTVRTISTAVFIIGFLVFVWSLRRKII